jgi:NDP-sugar pyrophosphorylase family protein
MAPIAGKPMVRRVIESLLPHSVSETIVVIGPQHDELRQCLKEGETGALRVRFVVQERPLGMADALSRAVPFLKGDVLVTACDSIVPTSHVGDLIEAHRAEGVAATLSLMRIDAERAAQTAIVELDGDRVVRIVEKPKPGEVFSTIASLPLYVLSQDVLKLLPRTRLSARGEYELQDAIGMAIEEGHRVRGVFTPSRLEVTTRADLLAANLEFLERGDIPFFPLPSEIGAGTRLVSPVCIEEGVVIGPGCEIGPRVYVERGSRIGAGVRLRDAFVLRGSVVHDGQSLHGELVG